MEKSVSWMTPARSFQCEGGTRFQDTWAAVACCDHRAALNFHVGYVWVAASSRCRLPAIAAARLLHQNIGIQISHMWFCLEWFYTWCRCKFEKHLFGLDMQTSVLQSCGSRCNIHHHNRTRHQTQEHLHIFFFSRYCVAFSLGCFFVLHSPIYAAGESSRCLFLAMLDEWNTSKG